MNMNLYSTKMLLSYKIKENASVERAIFNSARFVYEIFINRIHEGGHQISVKLCTNKERRKVYLYLCIPKLLILSSILVRPMLFFCKQLSLVVNKQDKRTIKKTIKIFFTFRLF